MSICIIAFAGLQIGYTHLGFPPEMPFPKAGRPHCTREGRRARNKWLMWAGLG